MDAAVLPVRRSHPAQYADPQELHDISDERPELVEDLVAVLEEQIEKAGRHAVPIEERTLTKKEQEILTALGYVD